MLLIFFFLGLTVLSYKSNSQEVNFKHVNINDGLSQNAIFAIIKDSRGFMWFGTKDGLNKYDGYNFVVYQHNPFDTTTLSSNYITSLFEDSRGLIWIGTYNGGLNVFDRAKEIFRRIDFGKEGLLLGNNFEIKAIDEDPHGNIWVATNGDGIFRVNVNLTYFEFTTKRFIHEIGDQNTLSSNQVFSIHCDNNNRLWLGTFNGLTQFDLKSGKFTNYVFKTKNKAAPENPSQDAVSAIHEDKNGTLWLGMTGGLVSFSPSKGNYSYFPHRFDVFRYGWGNIVGIDEDREGNLWLATAAELMKFDVKKEKYTSFTHDPFNDQTISFNSISSVYIDNTAILWVGTTGMGIDIYNPYASRFPVFEIKPGQSSRTTSFSVRSILEDDEGDVWVGTEVLYKWERKTGKVQSFEKSSNEPYSFGNMDVFSMIQTADGYIWAATTGGLFRYHPKTNNVRLYKFDPEQTDGIPQKEVYMVYEDREGKIWIATEKYLCKLIDAETGKFHSVQYHLGPPYYEQVRPVIFQDEEMRMWLGTKYGLFRFNTENETFKLYDNDPAQPTSLINNLVKSICADPVFPDRFLWIGTAGGLNRFDTETETFFYYTEENGLPNNVVYAILPDDQKNLWLSTNRGLSRFNPQTGVFRNFDVTDGLQSNEFNTGAYYKSKNGELFFGGIKGLNYFYPAKIKDNPNVPPVVLTKIKLSEKSLSHKTDPELLEKSVEETRQIVVSHKEDIITFEFAALEYSSPEKNQYAYQLENFNNKWIYTDGTRSATYTHLPAGEYIFRVKASNNDGVWNEEGLAVTLVVKPPWTNTWFAYVLFGLVLIILIYLIRRYEMNRIRLSNQLKIEKISTETLKQLDQLKSQFFANISHEFRTPLTLILGQIESVMSSLADLKQKAKLQVANRNARRLLTLINQLLDLSKLESGNMELNATQQNLVSFLKSLFYSFESLATTKNITLKFESESEFIPVVFDLDKMEKVFYNLVANAFKFTNENGEINVSIKTIDSLFVEICVEDNGVGMPTEHLSNVFDRFYQVDNTTTRNFEGSGIGLALVKELVELHNGAVSVISKVGEGSVFCVRLPMGEQNQESKITEIPVISRPYSNDVYREQEIIVADEPVATNENIQGDSREIVLVVEDNIDVRSYIREQLEEFYQVMEAENGEDGILVARDTVPDLIVTDLMMPKVNGFQFCKEVRKDERTSHIPIVMLTAKAEFDDKIEGLEIGVDDYITKPFSAKELIVRVSNLIKQRRLLRSRFKTSTLIKPSEVTATSVDQVFLEKVIKTIEINMENQDFTPESLAASVNMSVSQLNRKLNALIEQPAGQLMRSLRLQRAADLLKQKAGTVSEICYQLDFNDPAYFSRAFKKQFGCSPSEFIKN
ncbi:MAG TPA: two-component regulator propeller domain-containing protein [Draconibacterium sp.]|nr:two-component regulator propeller domain-containing protein [Draconibacterium sp.]